MMNDSVLTRVAALKRTATPELKQQWQQLFDTPPPRYNRRFLESRLAYRIQELAYGGLKPETIKRLEAMGAKSRATLTPPLKSSSALISLLKIGIEGVIFRVQP